MGRNPRLRARGQGEKRDQEEGGSARHCGVVEQPTCRPFRGLWAPAYGSQAEPFARLIEVQVVPCITVTSGGVLAEVFDLAMAHQGYFEVKTRLPLESRPNVA